MTRLVPRGLAVLLLAATAAVAQEPLAVVEGGPPLLVEGTVTGDGTADHSVDGRAGAILGVDMLSSGGVAYVNVLPDGDPTALFNGSIDGGVADVPLPADGRYTIRVYLMGAEADEGATVSYAMEVQLGAPDMADGLAGGPDWWQVAGVDGVLNVRSGPSPRHGVTSVLNNGDVLANRGCRRTGEERWCLVRADGSGVEGWVAGRYLVEAAAPQQPEVPEGGPVGNGVPFDATGFVPCATATGQPLRDCPFGVIREGPGNAGVSIATGNGDERQFLFEGGVPVSTSPWAEFTWEQEGDLYRLEAGGERYEIPRAVVDGG